MADDAGGIVNPEIVAMCGLAAVPGVGAKALAEIKHRFGSYEEAARRGARAILDEVQLRSPDARAYLARDPDLTGLGQWAVAAAKEAGARILVLGDEEYPPRLATIGSSPPVLYVRGFLARERRRVAVVGSRDPDAEGFELAREIGLGLARAGVEVVSGGARGIDTAAHEGAVEVHGPTVAVLGAGIDVVYPKENEALFRSIARVGAVITELAPSTAPIPRNFPRRNRIVAGLSDAVILVRAAPSSGALITAEQAWKQKRPVYAVPGSGGCDAWIASGKAAAASSVAEIFKALDLPVPLDDARQHPPLREPVLANEKALALWRLLDDRTPCHVDELALRAQIPAQEALRRLAELELKGMCLQRPGKYFLRTKG